MPNPIILPLDFYKYDYAKLSRSESNPKNRVRLLAMANIKKGMSLQAIGTVLQVHWKTIQQWLYRFRKEGISGLYVRATISMIMLNYQGQKATLKIELDY